MIERMDSNRFAALALTAGAVVAALTPPHVLCVKTCMVYCVDEPPESVKPNFLFTGAT